VTDQSSTREAVRKKYAEAALRVLNPTSATSQSYCCGGSSAPAATSGESQEKASSSSCCGGRSSTECSDTVTGNLYSVAELSNLPEAAVAASLGCGNPTALADLHEGEVVLDLGSGGGIDVLLSAKRVGPHGKAYGLDMTDEMLALARQNAAAAGVSNVEFLKGEIEKIPLPDNAVDVIISNCVINLSTDKECVLEEAFRVLKAGGRFAVSDVVVDGPVPDELRRQVELWVGCIAGALDRQDYRRLLEKAGFVDVSIQPWRFYTTEDMNDPSLNAWLATLAASERERLEHAFMSAFVRAQKPPLS
jgi:arsenite methyltransferase